MWVVPRPAWRFDCTNIFFNRFLSTPLLPPPPPRIIYTSGLLTTISLQFPPNYSLLLWPLCLLTHTNPITNINTITHVDFTLPSLPNRYSLLSTKLGVTCDGSLETQPNNSLFVNSIKRGLIRVSVLQNAETTFRFDCFFTTYLNL
jgi:hypothetical protein